MAYPPRITRNHTAAEAIQLTMQYAPEPPFNAGSPQTARQDTIAAVERSAAALMARRKKTAQKVAKRLGLTARA